MKEDFTSFSLKKYMACMWHVDFLNLDIAENRMLTLNPSDTGKPFGNCGVLREEIFLQRLSSLVFKCFAIKKKEKRIVLKDKFIFHSILFQHWKLLFI